MCGGTLKQKINQLHLDWEKRLQPVFVGGVGVATRVELPLTHVEPPPVSPHRGAETQGYNPYCPCPPPPFAQEA